MLGIANAELDFVFRNGARNLKTRLKYTPRNASNIHKSPRSGNTNMWGQVLVKALLTCEFILSLP